MKVTDAAGNEYERMEDEFLSDLGMMRMREILLISAPVKAG